MKEGRSSLSLKKFSQRAACPFCKAMLLIVVVCAWFQGYAQDDPLQRKITIPLQRTTLYQALNAISDSIGYYFIYDSQDVNSDKRVSLSADNETAASVIKRLLGNDKLRLRVVEQHILIYKDDKPLAPPQEKGYLPDSLLPTIVGGRVMDQDSKRPIPYVSVGIASLGLGTITNADGEFVLKVPPMDENSTITISHIGYKPLTYPAKLLANHRVDIYLETQYVPIQEVIIRAIDPVAVVKHAMLLRSTNYSTEPFYLTAFYREGVEKNRRYLSYSEAVFKVYKTSYLKSPDLDQVKLLKSRKFNNPDQSDTLTIKMKAGISASLNLDVVKSIPDFLDEEYMKDYQYVKSDIVTIDSRSAYAIDFEQKEGVTDPLYKGVIYIDTENLAIIGVDFEVNPSYIDRIINQLVVKRSRQLKVMPEKVAYSVSYRPWNGKYYLSHLRGDINIRVRKRNRLFSNAYHVYLEMATIQLDSNNVQRFARQEIIRPFIVFSDANFTYDSKFWGDYSYIVPEENLSEALSRVTLKIESEETDK